ncbi:hypothetical protein P3W24_13755 [Luteibacter sp. PPL201]|uniref:Uncharacterized protein n=1 Tax=Luteibacter sahnii TaxID=3021977 RepID=A0ABT6BD96_9GAMM
MSIEGVPPVHDGFYRQGPGDPLMLGTPHEISFPQAFFTDRDRFGLNSKQEGLDPTSGGYRQFCRRPVLLAGDSYRQKTQLIFLRSTSYAIFIDAWR